MPEIVRIESIERLNSSVNGNPRFRFYLSDGDYATSMSDAAFCYAVGNPGMRPGDTVVIERTRAGNIRHMGPYNEKNG
jgi:hypothetical protein